MSFWCTQRPICEGWFRSWPDTVQWRSFTSTALVCLGVRPFCQERRAFFAIGKAQQPPDVHYHPLMFHCGGCRSSSAYTTLHSASKPYEVQSWADPRNILYSENRILVSICSLMNIYCCWHCCSDILVKKIFLLLLYHKDPKRMVFVSCFFFFYCDVFIMMNKYFCQKNILFQCSTQNTVLL